MLNLMFDQGKRFDWVARQLTVVPAGENLLCRIAIKLSCMIPMARNFGSRSLDKNMAGLTTGYLSR